MPFVILSGELATAEPFMNAIATDALGVALNKLQTGQVTPVIGSYKGKTEHAFLVSGIDPFDYDTVRGLAEGFKQESILLVDDDGTAHLVFLADGKIQPVGTWHYFGVEQPNRDAWTLLAGFYFSTI